APSQAQARSSSHLVSGWAWIRWLSSTSAPSTRSNAAWAAPFALTHSVSVTMPESLERRRVGLSPRSVGGDHRADGPGQRLARDLGQRGVGAAPRLGQMAGAPQAHVVVS